ncbi:hypothetical protein A1O3_10282 [Capronia epimyces CBS 606.96]|uniref:Uncharacterized protein n=1 Tax=Capronia epimyces CBS 606.96 TaxID=1182542 RepID=W9Y3S6_9EURO|nr:uncharacterized protein A1O3_10282 [Capronia epimyces CBS 606.96]EXJ77124.1 hypothetical protein A1O3_10282 [Capronia epimyces CBS 606.96]
MDPNRVAIGFIGNPNSRHLMVSKVPISADTSTVDYMVGELLKIAHAVSRSQPSPFIHHHLSFQPRAMLSQTDWESPGSVGLLYSTGNRHSIPLYDRICELLYKLNGSAMPLRETVQNFQLFICCMIWFLFLGDRRPSQLKEKLLENMRRVAARMMQEAPGILATGLPRWKTWVLAESLRRAVLMTCLVQGIYHGWVRGYCYHELFIQALPFDNRPGLWNADSEEEWEALLADGGNPVTSKSAFPDLISFHEFASSFAKAPFNPGPDVFQRLLLIAHHGKGPVERALGSTGGGKAVAATSPPPSG